MGFEHLANIHARGNAKRVEDDVDLLSVRVVGHVLDRQDLGDHALVAVPAGELVADADLALLRHVHPDQLVHSRWEFGVVAAEGLDVDDLAALPVRDLKRGVAHFPGLLTEDGPQQAFFGSQFGLALRRHLAHQHIARPDFGADSDNPALVEVGEDVVAQVGDVPGDVLGTELGVSGVYLMFMNVD